MSLEDDVPDFFWLCPPRCYTCGKSIGHLFELFLTAITAEIGSFQETDTLTIAGKAMDDFKITRPCCRSMLMCPTKVFFDAQNLEVVKGNVNVENVSSFSSINNISDEVNRIADIEITTIKLDDYEYEHDYVDPIIPGIPTYNPLKNRVRQYRSTTEENIFSQEKPSGSSLSSVEVLSGATYRAV